MGCGMTYWRILPHWQASGVWAKLNQAMLSKLCEQNRIDCSRARIESASVASPGGAMRRGRTRPTEESSAECATLS